MLGAPSLYGDVWAYTGWMLFCPWLSIKTQLCANMKKHCSMVGLFSDVPDFFFVFLLSTIPLLIYWHQKQFLLLTNRYESKSCGVFRWWDWGTVFYTWPSRSNRFVAMSPVRFTCLRIHKKKSQNSQLNQYQNHFSSRFISFVIVCRHFFFFFVCAKQCTCDMRHAQARCCDLDVWTRCIEQQQ